VLHRFLKKGRIYRAAAWARYSLLKAEDFRAASEYMRNVLGIKTIIDLRSGEEKRYAYSVSFSREIRQA
jgi:hypothetical protein